MVTICPETESTKLSDNLVTKILNITTWVGAGNMEKIPYIWTTAHSNHIKQGLEDTHLSNQSVCYVLMLNTLNTNIESCQYFHTVMQLPQTSPRLNKLMRRIHQPQLVIQVILQYHHHNNSDRDGHKVMV
ncbi:hypothetical protein Pcinc_020939 [Petrolisthes cinctipes]|uniref:Uncharacterized protein n=1 Tax=Petrolisthes cinctipes TaxID=88211 RepID=A0AAE1KID1_PETCI|nr:hypothetical protein Pcinc_020939 [Petrolisthes cinctipes]